MTDLLEQLTHILGPDHVLVDPDLRASYESDWTGRFRGEALCVARPATTADVSEVMRVCSAAETPVVAQGGNTGLVGGSIPGDRPGVVLSMRRLTTMSEVDRVRGQITVGAGCTLESVQAAVAGSGWDAGIDVASRASATIGGMIATNAGGLQVIRHGMMRRRVVGVESVLASGEVLSSMRGLEKDNTGYDLTGLLCGSEGTLAVVTRAILQLVTATPHRVAAMVGVESLASAVEVLNSLRPRLPSLAAVEYLSDRCMELVRARTGTADPVGDSHGAYLLLECAGAHDPGAEMAAAFDGLDAVAVAVDTTSRDRLWSYRDSITESISGRGIPRKLDLTLPLDRMADFESSLNERLDAEAPGSELYLFGHLGDGGLHVNIVTPGGADDFSIDEMVFRLSAGVGGSVSAEHGIGRAKASALSLCRTPVEIATMRAIKAALDPDWILNPGVIFSHD